MEINNRTERLIVENADLARSQFTDVNLHQASFTDVDLGESVLNDVNLSQSKIANVNLSNVEIHDCNTEGMKIEGILVEDLLKAYKINPTANPREGASSEQTLLRAIVDALTDHIYVKDAKGRYLLNNAAHRRYLGAVTAQDIAGKTVFDLFPESVAELYNADDMEVIRSGKSLVKEEPSATGWLLTTKVPLKDASGKIAGVICISRDVTEARRFRLQCERESRTR